MTAAAVPVAGKARKPKSTRPVRDNVEGFAIAILFAVLLKPFLIEAYMIPTPSMQPTMMGSTEAGVHDRLLVDKLCYALREPKRWDIAVFRYPIRQIQSYVKRIVGIPGDRFLIAGGNIVPVDANNAPQTPVRRPAKLQARTWMNLFPARMRVDGNSRALDGYFSPQGRDWTEADGVLQVTNEPQRSVTLSYVDAGHGGLCNRIYDGYPTSVAKAMRASSDLMNMPFEAVPDARVAFTLQPSATVDELSIDLDVKRTAKKPLRYGLLVANGQGRLFVKEDGREVKTSQPFPFALEVGAATEVRFTHLDGQLLAERDGDVAGSLECLPWLVLDEVELQTRGQGTGASLVSGASAFIAVRGGGALRFSELSVDRDLHYMRGTLPKGVPIEVPAGHFFMMGDNPLQSADAREWTALTVGVDAQGRIVDPTRHPEARKLVGNSRARGLGDPVDADENPVIVPEHEAVVFTDLVGEVHVLRGKPVLGTDPERSYGARAVWFEGSEGAWQPLAHKVSFVPREHVLGRPVLSFWPIWPLGPNRFDVIR